MLEVEDWLQHGRLRMAATDAFRSYSWMISLGGESREWLQDLVLDDFNRQRIERVGIAVPITLDSGWYGEPLVDRNCRKSTFGERSCV